MPLELNQVSYDEVPYPGAALPDTHPSAIAVIARLFGLDPAPPSACRVLELGCGTGGNLLPMAGLLPGSTFTGIDLSGVQIGMARTRARRLKLKNVRFEEMNILDVPGDIGEFDYIICYGVYSWVPRAVREKILEICATHLAPDGVAAVSYNTYPGWHLRGLVRDMFVYHSRRLGSTDERVDSSVALLKFVKKAAEDLAPRYPDLATYSKVLEREMNMLSGRARHYFVHEHLEGVNEPCYLHEFTGRASAHGLAYLGDVRFSSMSSGMLPPETMAELEALSPDFVSMEQYRDFITNRTFRNSLLCHRDQHIRRDLDGSSAAGLSFTAIATPIVEGDSHYLEDVPRLRSQRGSSVVSLNSRLSFFALGHLLNVAPAWVSFDDLLVVARERLAEAGEQAGDPADDARRLGEALLSCLSADIVEAAVEPPAIASEPGERPLAPPYTRLDAQDGRATNLRHESFELPPFAAFILSQLDGKKTAADLTALVEEKVTAGDFAIEPDESEEPLPVAALVERALVNLAELATICG